jgi:hypothetical protein
MRREEAVMRQFIVISVLATVGIQWALLGSWVVDQDLSPSDTPSEHTAPTPTPDMLLADI